MKLVRCRVPHRSGRLIVVAPALMTASTMALDPMSDRVASSAEELHVVRVTARLRDGRDGAGQALLARNVHLLVQVEIRCRKKVLKYAIAQRP